MGKYEKIFVFVSTLDLGGAERVTYELALGLKECCYNVTVVALNATGEYGEAYNKKLNVIDLKTPVQPSWLMRPRALGKIIRILKSQRPNVIFCSHIPTLAFVVFCAAKLSRSNAPVLHIEHNTFSGALVGRVGKSAFYNTIRKVSIYILSKLFYSKFSRIIAVSDGVKNDILRYKLVSSYKIIRIYNPVVHQEILDMPKQKLLDKKLILGCGRLEPRKGFDILIQAFAHILKSHSDVQLVIIGEGSSRSSLETLIDKLSLNAQATLMGQQADPFSWYRKADVFVLSSREEGLPTVLIEAIACGATPVSTDCPSGPYEILEGGKYGYLVPVDDVSKMAEAIEKALKDPIDVAILKKRASYFSVDNAIKNYCELLEQLQKDDECSRKLCS